MHAIFMVFDDKRLSYFRTCVNSIKSNYPNHPVILVYYEGADSNVIRYLSTIKNLKIVELKEKYDYNIGCMPSNIIYRRFNLWTSQFDEYDKILYLDVDTIILNPLDHLFRQDNFYIFSDYNYNARVFSKESQKHAFELLRKESIDISHGINAMGNSGVMLIPKRYRTKDCYESLLSLANKYDEYIAYSDQSIISLWCWKHGIPIQTSFENNCQIRLICQKKAAVQVANISILHFSGESKFKERYLSSSNVHIRNSYLISHQIRLLYRKIRKEGEERSLIDSLAKEQSLYFNSLGVALR